MSLIQTFSNFKCDALYSLVCPVTTSLGIHAIPAASLLVGEAVLSSLLHYGVILPSPIGIELLEFPSKMMYLLERRRTASALARILPFLNILTQRNRSTGKK